MKYNARDLVRVFDLAGTLREADFQTPRVNARSVDKPDKCCDIHIPFADIVIRFIFAVLLNVRRFFDRFSVTLDIVVFISSLMGMSLLWTEIISVYWSPPSPRC